MQYQRSRLTCALCPLAGKKQILSEHIADGVAPTLAIIGDAPGNEEVRDGKPFTSPYGKLLNFMLYKIDVRRSNVYLGYSVLCQPTRGSSIELEEAMCNCRAGLRFELDDLYTRGTRVVLALGSTVLKSLGIEGKLETIRGSLFKVKLPSGNLITVIPTYEPYQIMDKTWKRKGGGTADRMVTWMADFKKAKRVSENPDSALEIQEDFSLEPTADDVVKFAARIINEKLTVAVDTETTGLSYDESQIVVIGLAVGTEEAMCVPILTSGGKAYFDQPGDWEKVYEALRAVFYHADQLYQNCFFDVPRLRKMGFEIPYARIAHDTMILHHTIAAEAPHDLGFITSVYGSTPYWKDDFKNRTCGILDMDQLTMRRYNLRDCVVLHQIVPTMLNDLANLGLEDFYSKEVQPLIAPIMDMTQYGIGINLSRVEKYKETIGAALEKEISNLYRIANLPPEFNVNSDAQVKYFLFGEVPSTFAKIDEYFIERDKRVAINKEKLDTLRADMQKLDIIRPKGWNKKMEKMTALQAKLMNPKPASQKECELRDLGIVRERVKPIYCSKTFTPPRSDKGGISVDKMALLSYKVDLNNRLSAVKAFVTKDGTEEQEQIECLLSWLDSLSKVALMEKLLSTYTKFSPWKDGRIHPYWKMHGTASGRLAVSEPNLQNLPLPREDAADIRNPIRSFFVAKPGHSFVSSDYVNLEAQLLAFETMDPELCQIFNDKLNLHDVNTREIFQTTPDDPMWSVKRKAAKVIFFACICYGGTPFAIHRKILAEIPSFTMTARELDAKVTAWMDNHPAYRKWETLVRKQALSDRKVRTDFGRIRIFLGNDGDIEKEALNHMIQSSGASLVNRAMVRIWNIFNERKMKARFVLQVHDQLVIECPNEETEEVAKIMTTELQRPFVFHGVERSIPCDCTVGPDFGSV